MCEIILSESEQQRRQKLLDEDFYPYIQKNLSWLVSQFETQIRQIKDPFVESMIGVQYEQLCLDYTAGKPIIELFPRMEVIIKYIKQAIDYVERHNLNSPDDKMNITILTEYFASEILPNLLGLSILFNRQDWFEIIVRAVDFDQENREKAIDSLISMRISNYPITETKTPRELNFRNPLYNAIQAETSEKTLKYLDEYLRCWYDGLRKAGHSYIDSHLLQQGDSRDTCSFVGYWCFEAAAVAYLKNIDDSSLHRFMYYPKDMIEYARA